MTEQRKVRGPYRKGIERREQILQIALEVFAEHGERGTSLQEIADRVGVTQQALLHYFGSRDELLIAVLQRRDRLAEAFVDGVDPSIAVAEAMRGSMVQPGLVRLAVALSAAATDPAHAAHGYLADRQSYVVSRISMGLSQRQHEGAARSDEDPAAMARLLLAVMDGIQLQWLMDPSVDMAELLEVFNRMCSAPAS